MMNLTWFEAKDFDGTFTWLEPSDDAPKKCRLTAARRTEQSVDGAFGDEHVDVLQVRAPSAVAEGQVAHLDARHVSWGLLLIRNGGR